jgi:hypothetical protein
MQDKMCNYLMRGDLSLKPGGDRAARMERNLTLSGAAWHKSLCLNLLVLEWAVNAVDTRWRGDRRE